ncbi:MAG: hypothetical protein WBE76_18735 [Terracidiphilus sp.]
MRALLRNPDATLHLTQLELRCTVGSMIQFKDIAEGLKQRSRADFKRLAENYKERAKLRQYVNDYEDLLAEAKLRGERIQRITAVIGSDDLSDTQALIKDGMDVSKDIALPVGDFPLWMRIWAIVEQVSEIQVIELQRALEYFDIPTSRQAIESALAKHSEIFAVRSRGRQKFVSLKR